jgi:hypothetical protein
VPETLMPALEELRLAYDRLKHEASSAEYENAVPRLSGRPTPLYLPRTDARCGAPLYFSTAKTWPHRCPQNQQRRGTGLLLKDWASAHHRRNRRRAHGELRREMRRLGLEFIVYMAERSCTARNPTSPQAADGTE